MTSSSIFLVDLNVMWILQNKWAFHTLRIHECVVYASRIWSVWEVINEGICMPAFFSALVSVYICMSAQTHTHTHRSTMSLWPLQSNSSRQKSLKQPLFFWASWDPPSVSSALNSHQPLLLPKITGAPLKPAPHHSAAWPQERDQNTHKKGNTSYCGRR